MGNSRGMRVDARRDEGAAAVEFALISVVFVSLLLAALQFGYTFFEHIQVAQAAREGVRWAALGQDAQVVPRTQAAAPGLDAGSMTISVTGGSSSDSVRVVVSYPTTILVPLPLIGDGVVLPQRIRSTAEARLE